MKYGRLVWVNLLRNKRRTILTTLSVAAALLLFVALSSVLKTLSDATRVGSESRMVTRNAISIVFSLPQSYENRLRAVPGVEAVSWAAWFGGVYRDPRDFFPQFAVDAESYVKMYPELEIPADQKRAFLAERSAALVGRGLMERFGWSLGQTINLTSSIYTAGEPWPFTIRAVYTPSDPSMGDDLMLFHYDYLYEKSNHQSAPGWYILKLSDPSLAAQVAQTIDDEYRNSRAATKTETERAFQTSFVTMWGNVGFLLNAVGMAVFFAILLVAASAMMMAARERTSEVAVLKTLGYGDGLLFTLVLVEALAITLTGGVLGVLGGKLLFTATGFEGAGFLPGFQVKWSTVGLGMAIALLLGLVSGALPAWQAARTPVVQTLRRVA